MMRMGIHDKCTICPASWPNFQGRPVKVLRWQVAVTQFGGQREGSGGPVQGHQGGDKELDEEASLKIKISN